MTPQEALQAIIDGKKLERRWYERKWVDFDPLDNEVDIESILKGYCTFRLAQEQEMITIGGVSFPKPETKTPKEDQYYFMPDPTATKLYFRSRWDNDECDVQRLERGFVHLSEENAIAHAKALIVLSGGSVDE